MLKKAGSAMAGSQIRRCRGRNRIKKGTSPGGRGSSLKVGEFLPVWVWASGAKERGRKAGGLVCLSGYGYLIRKIESGRCRC